MNRLILCVCLLLLGMNTFASTNFIEGNFEQARIKAKAEGKMLILDFYAAWCSPCRFMEATTFADEGVSSIINQKFIPLKIDIDDFDGYALKEHFGVKVLPTVLIFNSEGKVIERVEETLSPSRMTEILNRSLDSFTPVVHAPNTPPVNSTSSKIEKGKSPLSNLKNARYKIQLGIYNSYHETLKEYNKLVSKIEDPIIILHDYKAGNIVYRVMIGSFESTSDAHFYLTDLREKHGIEGHIYM